MMSALSLTILQSNLYWENKAANLLMFEDKIRTIEEETHVVILPEMFSTGFSMRAADLAETMDGPTVDWMRRISREEKIILTGSLIIVENGFYYNRLIWMLPNGQYGYYDKRHLFSMAAEHETYQPGHKRLIATVNGWKINLQICYDLRFPVWIRQQQSTDPESQSKIPEYDVLIVVANWPQRRAHAWKTLLSARAIENQCFTIGVNRVGTDGNDMYYSGNSLVVDPLGELLYHQADEEDCFTIQLQRDDLVHARERFPFLPDADGFRIDS